MRLSRWLENIERRLVAGRRTQRVGHKRRGEESIAPERISWVDGLLKAEPLGMAIKEGIVRSLVVAIPLHPNQLRLLIAGGQQAILRVGLGDQSPGIAGTYLATARRRAVGSARGE